MQFLVVLMNATIVCIKQYFVTTLKKIQYVKEFKINFKITMNFMLKSCTLFTFFLPHHTVSESKRMNNKNPQKRRNPLDERSNKQNRKVS